MQLYIRSIFLYLDRTYVIQTAGVNSLWDLGLHLWRDHIIGDHEVEKKLIAGLLALIERERSGEMVERNLIKNLLRMLASVGMYADRFEKNFVISTGKYYAQEVSLGTHVPFGLDLVLSLSLLSSLSQQSLRLLVDMKTADYLEHVDERLAQEEQRVAHYLESSTRRPLLTAVENALITAHAEHILQRGFDHLVEQCRVAVRSMLKLSLARHTLPPARARIWLVSILFTLECKACPWCETLSTRMSRLLDLKSSMTPREMQRWSKACSTLRYQKI